MQFASLKSNQKEWSERKYAGIRLIKYHYKIENRNCNLNYKANSLIFRIGS